MKSSLRIIVLLISIQTANAQNFNTALSAKLQYMLDSMVTMFTNTEGMSASVYYPGQGVWRGSSGLSYSGQPITNDMAYGIASNTKLFVAAAILKLADANVLSLNDSLIKYLPWYPNVNSYITIRQLLNHTSGVSEPFTTKLLQDSIENYPNRIYTPKQVLSWLGPPIFSPGKGYGYSNANYILAGMVVEKVTGKHISKIIRDSILNPLGLDSTFYDIEEPVIGNVAHRWYNGVDVHNVSRMSLNTSGGAAGSIFSTSADMVKWYDALLNGKILSENAMAEMTNFLAPGNYGLGISTLTVLGILTWGHGGGTLGYKSRMFYDPCTKISVCGLSNSSPSAVDGITATLMKIVIDNIPSCSGDITGLTTVCQGEKGITYTVPQINHATSYVWSFPKGVTGTSSNNSINVHFSDSASSGYIKVRGLNEYGVGPETQLFVTIKIAPKKPVITLNGNTIHSNATTGNQWYDDNGLINGAVSQDLNVSMKGNYYSIVTDMGCISDTSNKIFYQPAGIGTPEANAHFSAYPNPISNFLTLGSNTSFNYQVTDMLGNLVTLGTTDNQTTLNTSDWSPGVYVIKLHNGAWLEHRKIIKN